MAPENPIDPTAQAARALESEAESLARSLGEPRLATIRLRAGAASRGPAGFPHSSRRIAEVVLIVPRPGNRVLVHTKGFYPPGVWRLPTGGLRWRESIHAGLLREAAEETGRALRPQRFLFHARYLWDGTDKQFSSFGFLMDFTEGTIQCNDPRERIDAFRDCDRTEMLEIARHLERLYGSWRAWGRFRAATHRLLLEAWPRPGWGVEEESPPRPPS